MGTGASIIAAKPSPYCLSEDELKDPENVMFEGARRGNHDELLLVLQQGMDPNERESPFSG